MRTALICLLACRFGSFSSFAQESSPAAPPAGIPEGYEVGAKSVSPNGRFAILYPVRREGANLPPNLLVCLKPYSVLTRVGDEEGRWQGARGQPLAKWSGNSAVAIWVARKWGMEDLAIYEIEGDQVKAVQAIWQEVRKLFDQDFRERFLKRYPDEKASGVIFVSDEQKPDLEFKGRRLFLNLFADNKPNLSSGLHWTASLRAVWNIDKATFEKIDFRPGPLEERSEN